jgi:chemotaxis protein CheX
MDSNNESGNHLQLGAVLDLNAAAPLHERLLALRGGALQIDASSVERIGGQCLQVLLSARTSWLRDKLPFAVTGASDNFVNTLRLMGLSPDLTPAKETVE